MTQRRAGSDAAPVATPGADASRRSGASGACAHVRAQARGRVPRADRSTPSVRDPAGRWSPHGLGCTVRDGSARLRADRGEAACIASSVARPALGAASSDGRKRADGHERCRRDRRARRPTAGVHRPPHPLGPGVVRAVPDLPAAPGPPARRAAAAARARPLLRPFPARRPDGRGRRLPRGPAGERGAHPRPGRRRAACSMGPWYILMDEFLVSGETIVRDLQMGLRGAPPSAGPWRSATCPTCSATSPRCRRSCARPASSTPWCGGGCRRSVDKTGFWWEAPDGSTVRAEYLRHRLRQRRRRSPTTPRPWCGGSPTTRRRSGASSLDGLLFMNGTDHQEPQPWLGRVVAEANDLQDDYELEVTTLADYLAGAPTEGLTRVAGRAALGGPGQRAHGGGLEPGRREAGGGPGRAGPRAAGRAAAARCSCRPSSWPASLLELAWREMVRNAAHDSICACSVDEVVDAVLDPLRRGPPDRRRPGRPGPARPGPLAGRAPARRW